MYVNIIDPLACVTAFFDGRGMLSIISAGCGQLMNIFIGLELHGIFGPNLQFIYFGIVQSLVRGFDEHHILANRGPLVNTLIILEPYHIF